MATGFWWFVLGRIIVSIPMHPYMLSIYLFIALPLFLLSQNILASIFYSMGLGFGLSIFLASNIFFISLLFSMVNIKILEIGTKTYRLVLEKNYISFYGIPIPIIQPRILENKVVLAVNVGGAIIPLFMSILFLTYLSSNRIALTATIAGVLVTAIATYMASKAIPGIGIAVPSLLPPLVAVLTTSLFITQPKYLIPAAYVSGSMGSLLGADILRLKRDLYKFVNTYGPAMLSIGGAGTFDGIYLSGILAIILAILVI